MRDASGQMYMRNRYYDPQTGQFTQTDPIGLAGGLNSYGFAAGDPVTYADPYGLCAASQVQPAQGDNPEAVCPGGLTHGEFYAKEDGFASSVFPLRRNVGDTGVQQPLVVTFRNLAIARTCPASIKLLDVPLTPLAARRQGPTYWEMNSISFGQRGFRIAPFGLTLLDTRQVNYHGEVEDVHKGGIQLAAGSVHCATGTGVFASMGSP
ncbi:MAG: RHS repeat-associated core domain-containing protein [Gemmatimonadetes bacterium]|nr:RHS repeat-associated core domain-containing protein [Gemmatimonadota bacterium]